MTYIDPSKPHGLTEYYSMTQAPEGAKKYPSCLTIYCDTCGIEFTGDFVVNDHMDRYQKFQVARDYLNVEADWRCDDTADLCSICSGNRL